MTVETIIDRWETLAAFASDLGVPYERAKSWRARGSIPGQYWQRLVEAAARRGYRDVTLEALARAAATSSPRSTSQRWAAA